MSSIYSTARVSLAEPTVVIHGTALTPSQFESMGAVGSKLVWSPLSNLLLYGNTTDVRAADKAGIKISLAPDWGPSGSKNSMHELKVADLWNSEVMDSYFTNYQMVEMVTSNPAAAAEWQDYVGTNQDWNGSRPCGHRYLPRRPISKPH